MEQITFKCLMIEELDELVEVGFGGSREVKRVNKIISGVRKSEHNIDNIMHRSRQTLFAIENELVFEFSLKPS